MMKSEFLIGRFAQGIVVRLVGRATMRESPAFREAVEPFVGSGHVVFDARECEYLDSTMLGCLLSISKSCERFSRSQFTIVAPPAARVKLFSTSALDQYFDFVDEGPEVEGGWMAIDIEAVPPEEMAMHVMKCHRRLAELGGPDAEIFRSAADRLAKELGVDPDDEPTTVLFERE